MKKKIRECDIRGCRNRKGTRKVFVVITLANDEGRYTGEGKEYSRERELCPHHLKQLIRNTGVR